MLTAPMGAGAFVSNTNSTTLVHSSSQYWSRADASLVGLKITGAFTLCGWVKFTALVNTTDVQWPFIARWSAGVPRAYMLSFVNISGTQGLQSNTSATGDSNFTRVNWSPSTATWYFVCETYNTSGSANIKFYVNGSQQGTTQTDAHTSINNPTQGFAIGDFSDGAAGGFLDGKVDDVRVWSRELTLSDISAIYANPCTASNGASLQGEWLFDNDGTDASGNANTLTNNGSATFTADTPYTCSAVSPKRFPFWHPF